MVYRRKMSRSRRLRGGTPTRKKETKTPKSKTLVVEQLQQRKARVVKRVLVLVNILQKRVSLDG